jgi:hypothetical protein
MYQKLHKTVWSNTVKHGTQFLRRFPTSANILLRITSHANEEKYTLAAGSDEESCKKGTRNPAESLPNPQEGDSFEA